MAKIGCGIDKFQWSDVFQLIQDSFTYYGILIQIIIKKEIDSFNRNPSSNNKHYAEIEVENYTNEWTEEREELETDFTRDSKSCQLPCTEHFLILRPIKLNICLIDYYFQYQSQDIRNLIKQIDFRYTDCKDEELVTLIGMFIDSRDFNVQQKIDIGQTRQKFHITLKRNSELRTQRSSKCLFHPKDHLEKLLAQLQDSGVIREMGDDEL